ncbi:antitoxin Xre/MbcA/ParS toxin-binding domain-containing protein [Lysobacter korlensis]|uniref:Antitoxin Xre/MbcA/ParS toxin-binding domain-containing protein n=1 Tax=Lysobacter korlensis TaxID=553636 RepID=A0ABV6RS64_9GAMM
MTSKHIGPLIAEAWRVAWQRICHTPENQEKLGRTLRQAAATPSRPNGRLRVDDPDRLRPHSPEFQAALDEELAARGLVPHGAGCSTAHADRILAQAALRAASYLRLSERATAQFLAPQLVAAATVDSLDPEGVTAEQRDNALGLIRIFRALDAILPDREAAVSWLYGANTHLGNSPLDLLEQGRTDDVLAYLEGVRRR